MSSPVDPNVQNVVVTASTSPSDDVTVVIDGQAYGGWQDVRITRGIERLPSDFELRLTDIYAGEADALQIKPGESCVVKIGGAVIVTGYIDVVMPSISSTSHEIVVLGRSKCADLVDCSAEWPGNQIAGASVLEVAKKLAEPYDIQVEASEGQEGLKIPFFSLMYGETPFDIIERLCRYSELLAYDDPFGNLFLTRVSKTDRAASGFREGFNVQSASAVLSMHDRFSEYASYPNAFNTLQELGEAGFLQSAQIDLGVPRHRLKIFISDGTGLGGADVAQRRAGWEASRRFGRSAIVRLTTDSWRDRAGVLYEPNTLVAVDLPSLKITGKLWTISEVTYRKGDQGTLCDLVIMAPQAFDVAPTAFQTGGPVETAFLQQGSGSR
jgi:prophage tail gpP-like protein